MMANIFLISELTNMAHLCGDDYYKNQGDIILVTDAINHLNHLGLKGMAKAYENQLSQPAYSKLGFEDRFSLFIVAELNERSNRKINRLLKTAQMRQNDASLEEVDYRASRCIDQSLISSLSTCHWIEQRQNLIITGATGTGKSWLACAFGKQACRYGIATQFFTMTHFYEQIALSMLDGTLPRLRKQLIKIKLLILDDFGIGGIDTKIGPVLLDIIDQHSLHGAIIITSQFPSEKWYDLFDDPTIADAILDRILHKSHSIKLKGTSMRKSMRK